MARRKVVCWREVDRMGGGLVGRGQTGCLWLFWGGWLNMVWTDSNGRERFRIVVRVPESLLAQAMCNLPGMPLGPAAFFWITWCSTLLTSCCWRVSWVLYAGGGTVGLKLRKETVNFLWPWSISIDGGDVGVLISDALDPLPHLPWVTVFEKSLYFLYFSLAALMPVFSFALALAYCPESTHMDSDEKTQCRRCRTAQFVYIPLYPDSPTETIQCSWNSL